MASSGADWLNAAASGISAASGLYGAIKSSKDQKAAIEATRLMNNQNIEFQRETNYANLANERLINRSQLEHADKINELMRWDSKHAISDKKADMARAGYSTADPNMQGFSVAALSNPQQVMATQVAPQVVPEYDQQGVANTISAYGNLSSGMTDLMRSLSSIKLNKAQSENLREDTKGKKVDNSYKEAQWQISLATASQTLDNLVKDGTIKEEQANKLRSEITVLDKEAEKLVQEVKQAEFTSEHQKERFDKEIKQLDSIISDLIASASLKREQRNTQVQDTALRKAQVRIEEVRANLYDMGIIFDANNMITALAGLIFSKKGASQIVPAITSFFSEVFSSIGDLLGFSDYDNESYLHDSQEALNESLLAPRANHLDAAHGSTDPTNIPHAHLPSRQNYRRRRR